MKFYAVFLFYRCLKRLFPYLELTSMRLFSQKQDYKVALRKYRKALRYLDVCWEKEEIDEGKCTASNTLFSTFLILSFHIHSSLGYITWNLLVL